MKVFYHIWAYRPSWSCDPDAPNKLSFPRLMEAPHEIWLRLAQRFWRRRSLKMVDGRQQTTDKGQQRTDDGACLYYNLTNEPKGSSELKSQKRTLKARFDFVFISFRITWCPSAGSEVSPWLSARAVFILCRLKCMCSIPVRSGNRLYRF